jgi:hypothetical protein
VAAILADARTPQASDSDQLKEAPEDDSRRLFCIRALTFIPVNSERWLELGRARHMFQLSCLF